MSGLNQLLKFYLRFLLVIVIYFRINLYRGVYHRVNMKNNYRLGHRDKRFFLNYKICLNCIFNAFFLIKDFFPRFLLFLTGICGIIFFVFADFFMSAKSISFGINQLTGLIISAVILICGILEPKSRYGQKLYLVLLILYFFGLLFTGFKPDYYSQVNTNLLFSLSKPPISDLIINVLGFVPFSYVFFSFISSSANFKSHLWPFFLIFSSGILISVSIETVQYFIPGRTSSLIDLLANSFGTLLGLLFFYIFDRLS